MISLNMCDWASRSSPLDNHVPWPLTHWARIAQRASRSRYCRRLASQVTGMWAQGRSGGSLGSALREQTNRQRTMLDGPHGKVSWFKHCRIVGKSSQLGFQKNDRLRKIAQLLC